jgi:hypothetical protein
MGRSLCGKTWAAYLVTVLVDGYSNDLTIADTSSDTPTMPEYFVNTWVASITS